MPRWGRIPKCPVRAGRRVNTRPKFWLFHHGFENAGRRRTVRRSTIELAAAVLLLFASSASAQQALPLTLEQALASTSAAHPDVALAESDRAAALADLTSASARRDWLINFDLAARHVKPMSGDNTDDSYARVNARKNLFDFDRTRRAEEAARAEIAARDAALLSVRDRRRIEIMTRFFDVLVADQQYTADNEFMSIAYVNFDNARERHGVGQLSNVELAEFENRYQDWRVRRDLSQRRLRSTRALLAMAMNQPQQLPGDLADPPLADNQRPIPEIDALLSLLEANNPRLTAQRAALEASRQRVASLRAERQPSIDAELEGAEYTRIIGTRDRLRAGVILSWPLYQGERIDGRVAREQATTARLAAEHEKLKMELSQTLLETWQEAHHLQAVARAAARQNTVTRDLQLERSRAFYEVELKANLGDAMANTVEAKLRERRTEYQLALALARIEALTGAPLPAAPLASAK